MQNPGLVFDDFLGWEANPPIISINVSEEKAKKIATKSKTTLKIGKKAFYEQIEMPLSKAYEYASQVMVENMLEHDAKEGIEAFLDKRPPSWKE